MNKEDKLGEIINRCINRAKPHSQDQIGYNKGVDENGLDIYLENYDLTSAYVVRDELEHGIANYLRTKEAEINSKLAQAKCEAYELALTHSRPVERIMEEEK